MARIELEITGNATGLENASKKAASAVGGLTKSTAMSKAQIEAWDAAARRNSMEQYGNDAKRATASVNGLASAQRNLSGSTSSLETNIRGANTVGIEFSRIIQDAPFGIIGVGNNITQLTQSFANLRAQTGSTSQALGIAFRSMFSGANLLVLGVSAVTTAFTFYNMWARKNKKETEELDNGTKRYIDTLEGVARAQADGAVNAQKDLAQLNLLYRASQDQALSMEDRRKAAEELIKQYPRQFEGLTTEAVLAGEAATAYDKLSKSLVATARAAAIYSRVADNQAKILDKQLRLADLSSQRAQLIAQRDAAQAAVTRAQQQATGLGSGSLEAGLARRAQNQLEAINKQILDNQLEIGKITTENNDLQDSYNKLIGEGADLSGKLGTGLAKAGKATDDAAKLQESLNKLTQESIQASLSGYEKELQASSHKYNELRKQAEQYYRDGKIQAKDYTNYLIRLAGFEIAERGRIVPGARPAGLVSQASRGAGITGDVIRSQATVIQFQPGDSDEYWNNVVDQLDKQLGRAVQSFGRDFSRTLANINRDADATFGSVFGSLTSSIASGIGEVLNTTLVSELQGVFKQNLKSLGENVTKGLTVANIAGGIVSGIAKQTNVAMQTVGGLLSGATSGAATGGWIGAIVGAVVGGAGSFFQASAAKKAEDQRNQMIREQKAANALLERQTALAYASSIMGQMTAGGVVTGIMRDAFGQLVATVRGSDLEFVLQRARLSR